MAAEDMLRALQDFDVNNVDLDNIGTMPMVVKVIIWSIAAIAVMALGYFSHIANLQKNLADATAREAELRQEFEQKAFQAANLDAYRRQMVEMEESFGALVSQLPSDTEVPGLLEDITNKGLLNGLELESIDLQNEITREFYVELPIKINGEGSYHDLGAFISGMAGLPRIVTLHDFNIKQLTQGSPVLRLDITAKTYRYKEEEL